MLARTKITNNLLHHKILLNEQELKHLHNWTKAAMPLIINELKSHLFIPISTVTQIQLQKATTQQQNMNLLRTNKDLTV